jgi:hypothetical protein
VADISRQRLYFDVGMNDEFGFAKHYDNLSPSSPTTEFGRGPDGFRGGALCFRVRLAFQLVRTKAVTSASPPRTTSPTSFRRRRLRRADPLWRRLQHYFGFLDQSFPDGNYGVGRVIDLENLDLGNLDIRGDLVEADIPSPALQFGAEGTAPSRHVVAYLPPEFDRSEGDFPVAYFLGGYGTKPSDFRPVSDLLDILIVTGKLQNMFVVFLPGDGGVEGSFFVNHRVPEEQVPDVIGPTSGRYEDSILQDLIPAIERDVLHGRVRR